MAHSCTYVYEEGRVNCPLCDFISPSLRLHISHLRLVHSKDQNFKVKCDVEGCEKTFCAFAAFNTHVYRHHRAKIGLRVQPALNAACTTDSDFPNTLESVDCNPALPFVDWHSTSPTAFPAIVESLSSATFPLVQPQTSSQFQEAKFLLNLREGHRISQAAMSDVVNGCQSLCTQVICNLRENIIKKLTNIGVEPCDIDGFEELFADYSNLFRNIETQYKLNQYCINHLNLMVCCHALTVPSILFTILGTKRSKVC